ncbi:MAG: hypothetical protein QOH95_1305, partial [Gaiellaceae bacterium]|nr:hypothetical protein [Gaiellaceae bacterium]
MIRLLGPFEAPADVGAGRPRALLARLALDSGRVVHAETLMAALWGEEPPPSAPKVLQAHVSTLRKAFGRDAIETRSGGYVLHAETDLQAFELLAGRGRAARDPAVLRDALRLWRGEPLAEVREPFAEAAAARLLEMRLEALTLRIDLDLERGEGASLVTELRELVEREPLRERPRAQLMLALYRSGRQAEALAAYREGRARLISELGIEPGPELQDLERAILRQDRALTLAPATGRGVVVCIGLRLALLDALDRDVLLVELTRDASFLTAANTRLAASGVRAAAFTSDDPAADAVRLATEQGAELLVVRDAPVELLDGAPCDVALSNGIGVLGDGPVAVPF